MGGALYGSQVLPSLLAHTSHYTQMPSRAEQDERDTKHRAFIQQELNALKRLFGVIRSEWVSLHQLCLIKKPCFLCESVAYEFAILERGDMQRRHLHVRKQGHGGGWAGAELSSWVVPTGIGLRGRGRSVQTFSFRRR